MSYELRDTSYLLLISRYPFLKTTLKNEIIIFIP